MLRRKTLVNDLLKENMYDEGILGILNDFLSDRKCIVEVNESKSALFNVDLGCVQELVLGPKLFNPYTGKIPSKLTENAIITTYSDDSYVVVKAPQGELERL